MPSALYFILGLAVGAALTTVIFMTTRRHPPEPRQQLADHVTEETLTQARELVAAGKIIKAVKTIREETGWDLKRSKAIVDTLPRNKKNDDVGYHNNPL
jgi:ribosomal protein L7/L12